MRVWNLQEDFGLSQLPVVVSAQHHLRDPLAGSFQVALVRCRERTAAWAERQTNVYTHTGAQVTLGAAHLFVRWFDPRHEHPVAVDKLNKGVADWVTSTADPNGLHHARVSELTHTQLPVKELPGHREGRGAFCSLGFMCYQ